jgi:hypothetical protein
MLSLAVFLLPRLLPFAYRWAFAVLCGLVLGVVIARSDEDVSWERKLIIYLAVGTMGLFAGRYDIFPAACTFFAVQAGLRQRFAEAWVWSTFGFLLKLFPVVLWPALLIAEWRLSGRWRWDRLLAGLAAGVASIVVQGLFSHRATFSSYRYFLHRPLQLGSLTAGLSALVDAGRFHLMTSFGSINVITTTGFVVGLLITGLSLVAALGVLVLAIRGDLDVAMTSLALLTLLILASKVFSAQYLIWIIPLWARYRWRWQWLVAAGLTTLGYPVSFLLAHHYGGGWLAVALWIDFCRDLMLLWGTAVWFWPYFVQAKAKLGHMSSIQAEESLRG